MEHNSIRKKLYNYFENITKTKKIIIKYPEYISTRELNKLKEKNQKELNEIKKSNLYLQQNTINSSKSKRNSFINYLNQINSSEKCNENNSRINSDMFIKKNFIKKLKNKSVNNPRKYLEKTNKLLPSNLLDYIHPYEYLFSHKIKKDGKIESKSKNKNLKLHLSDIDFIASKNLFRKKINFSSRNNYSLNIKQINKTEIQKNSDKIKQKRINTENSFFNTNLSKIKSISRNKIYYHLTDNTCKSNKNIFITDNSSKRNDRKKELLNDLDNINERLNMIKKEINETENSNYNLKIDDDKEVESNLNRLLSKLLNGNNSINYTNPQSIKYLFKQLKKKNYYNDLTRQYSSYNKKEFISPYNKKFMRELLKMGIREKKESFLSNYYYHNNFKIKQEINQLQEKANSKIRKKFNKKTIKMKYLHFKNIQYFNNDINNYNKK